jgi:tripartite-type tricarboxylate transporter receptor subunit TctC
MPAKHSVTADPRGYDTLLQRTVFSRPATGLGHQEPPNFPTAAAGLVPIADAGRQREGAMKIPRRQFLHLAAGAAALPALSRIASAQTYPTRPVRIVVGFAPGGGVDITARLIGQSLSERLGQQFVVENRTGAGSNIGTEAVVNAAPDGYTLLLATATNAINATLYAKLNYDFIRDIAPVATIGRVANVVAVHPSFPAKTLLEFIAYAKANPGKVNMAALTGSGDHMAGELLKIMAGVDLVHVPYRGVAPALNDLIGAQVQVMIPAMPASLEHFRAGRLRALAVTTTTRSQSLPDVPAVSEFVPGFEASSWYGIGVPKKTPTEIVEKLNREIDAAVADPKLRARLADLGAEPMSMTPAEFEKFIAVETEKWGKVVKLAGIKVD